MLKYKFQNQIIEITDDAAYWLEVGYPAETKIEVEDFSEENKAITIRKDGNGEVYIVKPCGKNPRIDYSNDKFIWSGMELIKKVDYRDLL